MLSRLYRKAEALDQACLRAQGHPSDYALRQELLSALEWEDGLRVDHAPLIRDLFEDVRDQSSELSSELSVRIGPQDPLPVAELQSLRQRLGKLLSVLATRQPQPHKG